MMNTNYGRSTRKGFTLIELMVAMAITFLIVGILVSITGTAIDTWTRSREELRAARQAKAMVDLMANDFECLVTRSGGDAEWMAAVSNILTENGNTNAADIVFFTATTDRYDGQVGVDGVDNGGDVSCVGYQLQWKDPINSGSGKDYETYVLKRYLVDPDKTFETLLGKTGGAVKLEELYLAEYGTKLNESNAFVCENIIQFTAVFHLQIVSGNTVENRLVPIRPGSGKRELRIRSDSLKTEDPQDPLIQAGRVTAVEISLSVLTDAGITQLRSSPALAEDSKWVAKNSYNYSKLIQLPQK